MNIIIAGAGKVGFNLARILSTGHKVTIIDKNTEALHHIQNHFYADSQVQEKSFE